MLDFKKLEKELDEALAKETPESLDLWLASERALEQISPKNFIGHSFEYPIYNEVPSLITGVGMLMPAHFAFDFDTNPHAHWCSPVNVVNPLSDISMIGFGLCATFLLPTIQLPQEPEEEKCNFSLAA